MKTILYIIPHREIIDDDIQVSPHHRWEHLFIRELEDLESVLCASGFTTNRYTAIYAKYECVTTELIEKCISVMRYKEITHQRFEIEKMIIDNELACLEKVFYKNIGGCENGKPLSDQEMIEFRDREYDWDNVQYRVKECEVDAEENLMDKEKGKRLNCTSDKKSRQEAIKMKESESDTEPRSSQDRIAIIREKMMMDFDCQRDMSEGQTLNHKPNSNEAEEYGKGYSFVMFRLPYNDAFVTKQAWMSIVDELDKPKGLLNSEMKQQLALSFLVWPSWEEQKDFTGIQLFTFIKKEYLRLFKEKAKEVIIRAIEGDDIWSFAYVARFYDYITCEGTYLCR